MPKKSFFDDPNFTSKHFWCPRVAVGGGIWTPKRCSSSCSIPKPCCNFFRAAAYFGLACCKYTAAAGCRRTNLVAARSPTALMKLHPGSRFPLPRRLRRRIQPPPPPPYCPAAGSTTPSVRPAAAPPHLAAITTTVALTDSGHHRHRRTAPSLDPPPPASGRPPHHRICRPSTTTAEDAAPQLQAMSSTSFPGVRLRPSGRYAMEFLCDKM